MNSNTINLEPSQTAINCPKHGTHHHMISSTVPGHEGHWCQLCWLESLGKPLPVVQQYREPQQAAVADQNGLGFNPGEPSVELLRISVNGITANPDVPVDDIARQVLEQMSEHIQNMVQAKTEILVIGLQRIAANEKTIVEQEDAKTIAQKTLRLFRS